MRRWGVVLRIASRDARQSLGRTLTAVFLISLPIIIAIGAITFWDVTTSQRYQASSWLGHRSDVQAVTLHRSSTAIEQDITADFLSKTASDEEVTVTQSTLTNWVPAGDQLIAVDTLYQLHLTTQDGTGYTVDSGTQTATLDAPRVNAGGKSGALASNHAVISDDVARALKAEVGDTLTLRANPYDADNESGSTASVTTTIAGIFKGDSNRKVATRAELTSNTVYTDLKTTRELYQYKPDKEIYQDATFTLAKGVDVEKTMNDAKKLPVDWKNYQITRNDQYTAGMLSAAQGVRSMMRGTLIGVLIFAALVLCLVLLLWMNDRRREMGVLVSIGVGKPSMVAQYVSEMILVGIPSLALGWLCARGVAQWLGSSTLRSVNASAARELSSMGQAGGNLESNMATRSLSTLAVSVDAGAILPVSLGLLGVVLVCVLVSCMPMLYKSPRDLLGMQR